MMEKKVSKRIEEKMFFAEMNHSCQKHDDGDDDDEDWSVQSKSHPMMHKLTVGDSAPCVAFRPPTTTYRAVIVVQLLERWLRTPEIRGSNPGNDKLLYRSFVY